jgi:hypothetical protein
MMRDIIQLLKKSGNEVLIEERARSSKLIFFLVGSLFLIMTYSPPRLSLSSAGRLIIKPGCLKVEVEFY